MDEYGRSYHEVRADSNEALQSITLEFKCGHSERWERNDEGTWVRRQYNHRPGAYCYQTKCKYNGMGLLPVHAGWENGTVGQDNEQEGDDDPEDSQHVV